MGTRKGRKNEAFGFLSATEKSLWLPVCDRKAVSVLVSVKTSV